VGGEQHGYVALRPRDFADEFSTMVALGGRVSRLISGSSISKSLGSPTMAWAMKSR